MRLEPREPPSPDAFSGAEAYEASPAYAWIELTDTSRFGGDATAAMASVGIKGRPGGAFGAPARFVRLQLLMREETFEILAAKLERLLRGEGAEG